jgi:DNA-binding PadR family transcriptional regulator
MLDVLYIRYSMNNSATYEEILLEGWEDVYRKSQLSLLMLLALKDSPRATSEIKDFITKVSKGLQTTDEQSIYRALRRYHKAGMMDFTEVKGNAGPKRKVYSLTTIGNEVLANFLQRNIINVFYETDMQRLINKEFPNE